MCLTTAGALALSLQSGTACHVTDFTWDCFATHLGLENKVLWSQAETWGCSAAV